MNHLLRLNTAQAAAHAGCHVTTIHRAAESGKLHGGQRTPGGRWSFRISCLDAWLDGEQCEHQRAAA